MRKPIESYQQMAKKLLREEKVVGCEELIYLMLDASPALAKLVLGSADVARAALRVWKAAKP